MAVKHMPVKVDILMTSMAVGTALEMRGGHSSGINEQNIWEP
jgi:hypothetical protein